MTEYLFVIGPQRAGTTWLYELFCQQPVGVYLDRIEKENYFFTKDRGDREASRSRFLSKLTGKGDAKLYVDVVSTYFGHTEIIRRILELFPAAKFVIIHRDEQSRRESFSQHREFNKLATAIIGYHISWELYEKQARFDQNVRDLHEFVPDDQILQLSFDDLKSSQGLAWTEAINRFIDFGVEHVELGQVNKSRVGSSLHKRCFYACVRVVQATRLHIVVKRCLRFFQARNTDS